MASRRYAPAAPTIVDLFAGAGGLVEGFRQAGFRVLLGNDSDPDACATFELNFPEAQSIRGDVRVAAIKRRILEGDNEDHANWRIGHVICFPNMLRQDQIRVPLDDTNTMQRRDAPR